MNDTQLQRAKEIKDRLEKLSKHKTAVAERVASFTDKNIDVRFMLGYGTESSPMLLFSDLFLIEPITIMEHYLDRLAKAEEKLNKEFEAL